MPHDGESVTTAVRRVTVSGDLDGQRLDNFLLRELQLPRTRVYRLIRKGEVRVNRGRAKPMQKLRSGDEVRIPPIRDEQRQTPAAAPPADMLENLAKRVLYSGPGLRIIDKPSGWASQPGTGIRWSLVELSQALWGEDWQPAHRLDKDTSGCLAVTEGRRNFNSFGEGDWGKRYLALVHGAGPSQECAWEDHLARMESGYVHAVSAHHPDARHARSRVRTLMRGAAVSLLELRLETGRTHQIRVQCASRSLPLVGDNRYGDRALDQALFGSPRPRLALHAVELSGQWQGSAVQAEAPIPADITTLLDRTSLRP